jgi:hypothetical protein
MMKRLFKALMALTLVVTLAGCSPDKMAYRKYSGTWVVTKANVEESETATNAIAAALAIVKLLGGEISMELINDGTGKFGISTEKTNLTWDAKVIKMEEKDYTYEVKDGVMTLHLDEKNTVTLEKKQEAKKE